MPRRKTTSYKIDPKIRKRFKKHVEKQGLSTCFVLEGLMTAYMAPTETQSSLPPGSNSSQPIVIKEFHHHYHVSRPRRRKKWSPEEESIAHDVGSPQKCALCNEKPTYLCFKQVTQKDTNRLWLCTQHFEEKQKDLDGWKPI